MRCCFLHASVVGQRMLNEFEIDVQGDSFGTALRAYLVDGEIEGGTLRSLKPFCEVYMDFSLPSPPTPMGDLEHVLITCLGPAKFVLQGHNNFRVYVGIMVVAQVPRAEGRLPQARLEELRAGC